MTWTDVLNRNYTFCTAYYGFGMFERFLVSATKRAEAKARALAYCEARWGAPRSLEVYPRNYVRRAKALYESGAHD